MITAGIKRKHSKKMRDAAWEKYYAEARKPCGNWGDGMRLAKLPQCKSWERAKERYEAICAELKKGGNNRVNEIYYNEHKFNNKINHFRHHPKFEWLRKYADDALIWNTMCGYYQIKAEEFIKRIIAAPLSYIEDWLNGKNQLELDGVSLYENRN